jgi:hypothetical protein
VAGYRTFSRLVSVSWRPSTSTVDGVGTERA